MKLEVDLTPVFEERFKEVANRVEEEIKQREAEKWMDLETTCDYLQVSRSNLSKFIKELDFPVSVINQTKRCNRKKVDEWMAQFEI
ncbi:helix-turn-helix domain-containing protein [Enterococcus casseliflavus]|uniref:helix-turn-helix domain-containing protein n=1 Tax=Enterococcus casseliflavus TaxID=37734 RepID=UPI00115E033E|nr:helix-turn-helix domain-containing protein [Enterococcus casseliflavus]MDT2978490.1 hypothetical protein [Enterococcus casseliflavus]MEB6211398.1 hypothetical protein [Enterococcus casseliflavus]